MLTRIMSACSVLLLAGGVAQAGGADRMLDPLTLPPRGQAAALYGPLGDYGPFGEPADPGCYWSRISAPTPQGVRWMVEETCSDLGTQAH